jgi:ribosomal protein S18 acetylase RimI-like enzyme
MQNLKIKKAEKSDCKQIMELVRELAVFEKAPDEVTVSMEHFVESGFGKNPVWEAFVAEVDERIVGMSLFYIRYSTWKGKRLYLEDLIVTEEFRGKGLGKILFDKTIEYGKEKGYSGMMWQVLDWNEPAINFYKKYNAKFDGEWLNTSIEF